MNSFAVVLGGFIFEEDCPVHREAFGLEIVGKKHAERRFVLDNQNASRRRRGCYRARWVETAFVNILHFFCHVQTTVVGASDRVVRPFGRSIGRVSPVTT